MEILTRITGGWLTFKDLEKALDVPAVSLRRYHDRFPTYLVGKKVNRSLAFPRESIETFRMINELYKEGLDTATVQATLAMHFAQTVDVKPMPPVEPSAPAQAPDLQSAPAIHGMVAQLLPLAERFVSALEAIAAGLAPQGPQDASKVSGGINHHPDHQTGQDMPQETPVENVVVDRDAVIARVLDLHGEGLGQHAITTRVRREGLRLSARGKISKSTVAKIVKGEISN